MDALFWLMFKKEQKKKKERIIGEGKSEMRLQGFDMKSITAGGPLVK